MNKNDNNFYIGFIKNNQINFKSIFYLDYLDFVEIKTAKVKNLRL